MKKKILLSFVLALTIMFFSSLAVASAYTGYHVFVGDNRVALNFDEAENSRLVPMDNLYFKDVGFDKGVNFINAYSNSTSDKDASFTLKINSATQHILYLQQLDENYLKIESVKPYSIWVDGTVIQEVSSIDEQNEWKYEDGIYTIRHATDTITVNYESSPPVVESVNIEENFIDRDKDRSGGTYSTEIEVSITDNDGVDDISHVGVYIRDNNDTIVLDNAEMTESTQIDENTENYIFSWNPSDSLDNLGFFDTKFETIDNDSNSSETAWDNYFVVDDENIIVNISPVDNEMGLAHGSKVNISGSISRMSGMSGSVDNVWIDTSMFSEKYIGSDNSYSENYEITADPRDTVTVTVSSFDKTNSGLDGVTSTSFQVNDNRWFNVKIKWEDNNELVPDGENEKAIENLNYHLSFYFKEASEEIDMENNPEFVVIDSISPITFAQFVDNDIYFRNQYTFESGDNLNFYASSTPANLGEYTLKLQDRTGKYDYPDGIISIKKRVGDSVMEVEERKWTGDDKTFPILNAGDDYHYTLINQKTGVRKKFPTETFPRTQMKTIQVGIEGLEDMDVITKGVGWRVIGDDDNINLAYQDNEGNTGWTYFAIYDNLKQNIIKDDNFTTAPNDVDWVWDNREENKTYMVKLQFEKDGEVKTLWRSVGEKITPTIPQPTATDGIGFPIPLAGVGGFTLLFVIVGAFTRAREEIDLAMLVGGLTVPTLSLIGRFMGVNLMPIPTTAVALVTVMGVGYYIGVRL